VGGKQDFKNYMKTRFKSEHSFDINPVIELKKTTINYSCHVQYSLMKKKNTRISTDYITAFLQKRHVISNGLEYFRLFSLHLLTIQGCSAPHLQSLLLRLINRLCSEELLVRPHKIKTSQEERKQFHIRPE